jgi:hypothetical protein
MPPHEPIITLSIQETGQASQPVFFYHVRVDEEVIASNQQLSAAASQTIRDVSRQYNQLFEQRDAPHLAIESLQVLGAELFSRAVQHLAGTRVGAGDDESLIRSTSPLGDSPPYTFFLLNGDMELYR